MPLNGGTLHNWANRLNIICMLSVQDLVRVIHKDMDSSK